MKNVIYIIVSTLYKKEIFPINKRLTSPINQMLINIKKLRESIVETEIEKDDTLFYIILHQGKSGLLLPKLYKGTKNILCIRMLPLHYCLPPFFWTCLDILKRRGRRWLAIFKQRKTNCHPLQLLTIDYTNIFERIANQFYATNAFQFW